MAQDQQPQSITQKVTGTIKSTIVPGESELAKWKRTFESFAKVEIDGKKYLDVNNFIDAIAPTDEGFNRIKREQYSLLFRVADLSKRGLVSWEDFTVFETLLKRPDADYQLAFQVFDVDASGSISFNEFKSVFEAGIEAGNKETIPFNFESDWVKLYLGKRDGSHVLGYNEFTQLIKGLQGERLRQAFRYFDKDGDGYILPTEFQRIIMEIAGHKLSESVLERLPTLCTMTSGRRISYSEVIAFHNIIREMDTVERVIRDATAKSKDGRIDVSDFLNEAAGSMRYGVFTPMEANIIWHFASRGADQPGQRLATVDFAALLDAKWQPPQLSSAPANVVAGNGFLGELARSTYNFIQGGIAGGIGATVVYPIDLVKTRLQNQRSTVVGEVLYRNAGDCIKKVYANEGGFRAFYRGVGPQLVGVAPEKAIKLTVNELVRKKATDPETGRITLPWEILAGGTAGGCQVIVTNPLEVTKIRLQMAGEISRAEGGQAVGRGAMHIIRGLGLVGLYKGAYACIWRDVPFSAIYFTAYAHLKKDVFGEGNRGKVLSFGELLAAASIAGMPAAYLTTPADVVKTRLQSQARAGETVYKGVVDGFRKIAQEEGVKALYKGGIARVIRSSPQFGVTLVCYELFHKHFPYPFGEDKTQVQRPTRAAASDISRVRARNALKILLDCSSHFGEMTPAQRVAQLPKVLQK